MQFLSILIFKFIPYNNCFNQKAEKYKYNGRVVGTSSVVDLKGQVHDTAHVWVLTVADCF